MRINVYAEEITGETALVTKEVEPQGGHPHQTFYGVRLYLASPDELHDDPNDDDRSAITLWVPWTKAGGHNFAKLEDLLLSLDHQVESAQRRENERVARTSVVG